MNPAPPRTSLFRTANGHLRVRVGLSMTILGLLTFVFGAEPGLIGQDRSPVLGYLQISVFLVGLAIMCLGGYICINGLWNGKPRTIAADIGLRLVGTGYVIAFASGLADLFGFGSQQGTLAAYFGPWQMRGVLLGEGIIALGFLLLIPPRQRRAEAGPPAERLVGAPEEKRIEIHIDGPQGG
jgi:hypothetical protein